MKRSASILMALFLLTTGGSLIVINAVDAASSSGASWEQEWKDAIAKAKNEGPVTIYSTWKPSMREAVKKAFYDKFGLKVDILSAGRGSETVAKVKTEQSAGLYLVDFFGGGSTTAANLLKPAGLLGPMEPLLILPEVKDPKVWRGGDLPFNDKAKQFLSLLAQKQIHIIYNTDLIRKGEISTYKDLLKPQYKGKISINDPSTSGAGASMMTHLAYEIWSVDEALDYLKQLIETQQVEIQRDNRIAVESVARGKFAIGLGCDQQNITAFMGKGAPIDGVYMKELSVSAGSGGISAANKLAHPNAAKVFLNWLMTKEGLTAFSQGSETMSMRTDVVVDGVNPLYLFKPGEKYFWQTEEKALNMGKMVKLSAQLMKKIQKKN